MSSRTTLRAPRREPPPAPRAEPPLADAPRHALARLGYVAVILLATLTRLRLDGDLGNAAMRLQRALLWHFYPSDVVDAVRNVALFAGFGAVWIATARPTRLARRVWHATALGVLLSAAVELAQCFSPVRLASVLDVTTNGLGALAGAATLAVAVRVAEHARRRATLLAVPLLLVALPYAAACALEAFSPLGGLDAVPGAWGGFRSRWAAVAAHLAGTPRTHVAWWDVPMFAAAGALVAAWLAERRWRPVPAAAGAAAGCAALWALGYLARGAAGGDLAPRALAARTAAALVGAALVAWRTAGAGARAPWAALAAPRAGRRDDLALAAYLALVVGWSLRGGAIVRDAAALVERLRGANWVPLAAQYDPGSLHGVADVAVGFLLWFPVGAWLAARAAVARTGVSGVSGVSGVGTRWRELALGLAGAAAAELAQLFVGARTVDVTDLIVQVAGVLVGWSLLRRADARAGARPRVAARDAQSALGYVSGGSSSGRQAGARSSGSTARVAS